MHSCIIFAEYHTPLIRSMIEDRIREIHKETPFQYILSEELGPHTYTTPEAKQQAIKDKCYSISDRTLRLGLELKLPVVGIDLWDLEDDIPLNKRHALREQRMLQVIEQYRPKGNIVVLLGAAHVRKRGEIPEDKSESVVYTKLKDKVVIYTYVDTTLLVDDSKAPSTDKKDIEIRQETKPAIEGYSMPNPNRAAVEEYLLSVVDGMDHTGYNGKRYRERFAAMSDAQFDKFMQDMRGDIQQMVVYAPNMKINLRIDNLLATAKRIGLNLFERIRIWDTATKRFFLTPHPHLVALLPIRRMKQYQASKISVPDSDTNTDLLTGQVVRPDKGSSISLVEAQTLLSKNLNMTVTEFLRVRGGDIHAYADLKAQLEETGSASLKSIDPSTKVRSSVVLSAYLKAMHIDNNLVEL